VDNLDSSIYRMITLSRALKLEIEGMKRRGRSVYAIIKDEFGFKGGKQKVLDQLEDRIIQMASRINP